MYPPHHEINYPGWLWLRLAKVIMLQSIKITGKKLIEYSNREYLYPRNGRSSTRKWWTKVARRKMKYILIDETELEDNEDYSE